MFVQNFLLLGTGSTRSDAENRSISFSNIVYFSLPVVYVIFMLIDVQIYLQMNQLAWDQLIVPLFIVLCGILLYLNHVGLSLLGRIIFLISWPLAFHIVPIFHQQTPSDYYLAYPMGIIFHAVLIQNFLPRKTYPWLFFSFMLVSFGMILTFGPLLNFFDTDIETVMIPFNESRYYKLVGLLYWLIFNFITFYLLEVLAYREQQMHSRQSKIQKQSKVLKKSLEDLQNAQRNLIQSEKMASLGMLSSGLAHEINNPLNFIKGGVFNLKNLVNDDAKTDPLFRGIEEGTQRIAHIVNSLTRYNAREKVSECAINEVLDHCLVILRPHIQKKVQIDLNFDPALPGIRGHEGRLHQAFLNILKNAFEAIGDRGTVRVRTVGNEDHILVAVADTGSGIHPEVLDKITDPFYTTKSPGEGQGLGLYITRNIIEEHGGEIIYDSTPGKGTNCQVILPIFAPARD